MNFGLILDEFRILILKFRLILDEFRILILDEFRILILKFYYQHRGNPLQKFPELILDEFPDFG